MSGILPSFKLFTSKNPDAASKREAPRHRQHGLACNLGDILDLSTTGARIRCRHVPQRSDRVDVVLTDYTRQGDLAADIVWMKPSGNFHYEVGLKFRKLTRDLAGRLSSIAMNHRFRRAV